MLGAPEACINRAVEEKVLKNSKLRAAMVVATILTSCPALAEEPMSLKAGFENPPQSARPRVWWHWMNGNVTIDGIDKDLAWMERIGIGGVQNFDANLATPLIVEKRLVYMDDGWKAAFKHAVQTADKKGLEFAIAASPGWSETGGPWVKPADGMKKLVWSETVIVGGKRFNGKIAPTPNVTGPWQTAKLFDPIAGFGGSKPVEPPRAGGDVAVIALPTPSLFPVPHITEIGGAPINSGLLSDADVETTVEVPTGSDSKPGGLVLSYAAPVTARSLRFYIPHSKPPFGSPIFKPVIEAEVA